MKTINLSKRLKSVAHWIETQVPSPIHLLDIGSDHAYLPIALIQAGIIQSAIAGEVVEGPYQSALSQSIECQVTDRLQVRLGDGYQVLKEDDHVNVTSICGMGGQLIRKILEKGLLEQKLTPHLVLQANNHEELLRSFLWEHGYQIELEQWLQDKGKTYNLMFASQVGKVINYSTRDLKMGKKDQIIFDASYLEYCQHQILSLNRIIEEMSQAQSKDANFNQTIDSMRNKLNWFKEEVERCPFC